MTRGLLAPRCRTGLAALALAFLAVPSRAQPLTILDVPFIAQSELLCGGAAAAMVMRYWGERGVDAETFQPLVDRKAGGIRTDALTSTLRERHWNAIVIDGSADNVTRELQQGRPVIALIEDHPGTYHYVVIVGRSADGVVFHDPARSSFRVASANEFDRRWAAANRWMLVVTPSAPRAETAGSPAAQRRPPATVCEQLIDEGIRQAEGNDLESAERTLARAISCPGGAAFRELAGIRALQRRWPEAADLAAAALARDGSDAYASRLLATARFVTDDPLAALDAWNHVDEPRIDLIRVDGLVRTRYAVIDHGIGLRTGTLLTRADLLRARRRLNELPAGSGIVDFVPLPGGLAEVHATVAERSIVPRGAFELGVLALATSVTRELSTGISSLTGGGEQIGVDWRFWAHRPLYQLSIAAPAPWRGVWTVAIARERQPYSALFTPTLHDSVRVEASDWGNAFVRWQAGTGLERWNDAAPLGTASAGMRLVSGGDRFDTRVQLRSWFGGSRRFARSDLHVVTRSSARPRGVVIVADGGIVSVTADAPPDVWAAGDTGRARPLLLRAHPVLGDGERFRTERLARLFVHESTEVQRWWPIGPFRAGAAAFVDTGRSARRAIGNATTDVDVGVGVRGAYPGKAGSLRLDIAHGLRGGGSAISVVYTSAVP